MNSKQFNSFVGGRIKEARKAIGLPATDMAKIFGFTKASMANIENGRQKITPERLHFIASLTKQPISFFFPPLDDFILEYTDEDEEVMVIKKKKLFTVKKASI